MINKDSNITINPIKKIVKSEEKSMPYRNCSIVNPMEVEGPTKNSDKDSLMLVVLMLRSIGASLVISMVLNNTI